MRLASQGREAYSEKRITQHIGGEAMYGLNNLFNLLGLTCDLTNEIQILSPSEGEHFSGSSPKTIKVVLEIYAGNSFNQQRTSGALSVNGVQQDTWNEHKPSSHPFQLDFYAPISSGANTILAASDNGNVQDSRTVYLDP